MTDKIIPTYKFKEVEGETLTPIRRTIQKTMEVTEEFNVFEALQYRAKLVKAIADKQAEIDGLNTMVKAYDEEIAIIEEALGVQDLEVEYQKELAEKNAESEKERQDKIEAELKAELLKTGNFVEKDAKDNQGN